MEEKEKAEYVFVLRNEDIEKRRESVEGRVGVKSEVVDLCFICVIFLRVGNENMETRMSEWEETGIN